MTSVSVVIPCFNLGGFVEAAVDSALEQSRAVDAVIVIDDGSTDANTRDVLSRLQRPRTRVIRTENRGLARARNLGIEQTTTPYVVTLDADDVLDAQFVEVTAGELDRDPSLDFVGCAMRAFAGADYVWAPDPSLVGGLVRGSYHASTLMRRTVFDAVGGFNPAMLAFETSDFFATALERGFRGAVVDQPLLHYRVRRESKYHQAIDRQRFLDARRVLLDKHVHTVQAHAEEIVVDTDVFAAELAQHRDHLTEHLAVSRAPAHRHANARVAAHRGSVPGREQGGAILLYHRVGDVASDVRNLAIAPGLFREHVRYLQERCTLMSLDQLLEATRQRAVPPRAIVLTLDDGYLDALNVVAPILRDLRASATFFVNTGDIDDGRETWGDTLERIFLEETPPPMLSLSVGGTTIDLPTSTPSERAAARTRIADASYRLAAVERAEVLKAVVDWSGLALVPRDSHRRMTADELRLLDASEGCAIGAHTVNHLHLTAHSWNVQCREIADDRVRLRAILGREVDVLAYPYGVYDETTVRAAAVAGMSAAVTVDSGLVRFDTSPLRLPRVEPPLADFDAFALFVDRLFAAA